VFATPVDVMGRVRAISIGLTRVEKTSAAPAFHRESDAPNGVGWWRRTVPRNNT